MQRYMMSDSAWDSAILPAMLLSMWHWHDVLRIDPFFLFVGTNFSDCERLFFRADCQICDFQKV